MEIELLRESNPPNQYAELFHRHGDNPILTARDWPYPAHTVFNAGACQLGDETVLLVRVEDRRGHSHLTVARSNDGVSNWRIDSKPSFAPDPANYPEEAWGVEDARLTWVEDRGQWIIAYTAYSHSGPLVSLAETKDFSSFSPARPGHAPRGQGRGRLSPPVWQSVRDDSSAGFRGQFGRAHLALLLARPDSLGRPPNPLARAARRVVGCQQDRPGPAAAGDAGRLVDPLPRRASDRRRVLVSTWTGFARLGGSLSGSSAERRMGLCARDALRAPG